LLAKLLYNNIAQVFPCYGNHFISNHSNSFLENSSNEMVRFLADVTASPSIDESTAVRIIDIAKSYGSTLALAGISFEVQKGEIFGLLGHNGAGKTTTIRILKGMIKPTSGEAFIFGRNISDDPNWVKQHTGYLPEEGSLIGRLTPTELCEFIGGLFGVSPQNSRTRALEFFKMFGLFDKKDELVEKLSRGMKQKLSIISSIIHDPELIYMDEPLASLDPSAAKMVKDFINYLAKEKGKTIIISSHRLPLVQDVCDRVAIIHQGSILVIDSPANIMKMSNTTSLEEAYLTIVPGYIKPVFDTDGTLIEATEKTNELSQINDENLEIKQEDQEN